MKKFLIFIYVLFFGINPMFANEDLIILPSQRGNVQEVIYQDLNEQNLIQTKQDVTIRLKTGENIVVENILTGNPFYDVTVKKGQNVILHTETDGENIYYSIEDVSRSEVLIFLTILFAGLLIYVGKKKGFYSLVSIVITCLLIIKFLVPMMSYGINPIISTILICLVSTAVTMYLVGGINRKSTSAIIGCVLSIILAGILSLLTVKFASLTGFIDEVSMFLYSFRPELDFKGIIISTMLIATMGAVMDVSMSIASTINEIFEIDNTKTVKELFQSGMNVGRDIIGTMANTLILIYLGSSMPLLMMASNVDFQKFINLNQVVTEISSALIGSCAIIFCVPITAFVTAEFIKKTPQKIQFEKINS